MARLRPHEAARLIHADRVERREKETAAQVTDVSDPIDRIDAAMKRTIVPKLQDAWDNPAELIKMLTARRMGKTEFFVRRSLLAAAKNPRTINPIIYPTAKAARDTAWKPLLRARQEFFPDSKVRGDQIEIQPYGGKIEDAGISILGGCETASDVGKWYGKPFADGIVDECGNFGPHLETLIAEGLEPGMMDFQGALTGGSNPRLFLGGNPGPVLTGYWYDITKPDTEDTAPLYTGDARDNPYIKDAEAYFRRILTRKRWTVETPTFRRMYLGLWCMEEGVLVYPIDALRNLVTLRYDPVAKRVVMPTHNSQGFPLPVNRWRFGIGCDTGQVDLFTAIVHASHPASYEEYIVHAEGSSGLLDDEKALVIESLLERFPKAATVIDPGGGGKHLIQTLQRRNKIAAQIAYKPEKIAGIRETRDGFLGGWLKVANHECTKPLRDELSVLGWDDNREKHNPNQADHFADGMLYIVRYAAHYRSDPSKFAPQPAPGTQEAMDLRLQQMIDEVVKREDRAWRKSNARGRGRRSARWANFQ